MSGRSFFAELRRRNVLRAAILYVGVVWALSQGAAQLLPVFDVPNWAVRWFIVAAIIGFPFWIAFAWFFELTPEGLKLERDVAPQASITRETGRKLDFAIIGVLAIAVVLLLTDRLVLHRNAVADVSEKSIAVLPLVNTGGEQANEYFSDGLSEELINTLGKLRDLTVIGRNSSFQFKGKNEETKVIAAKLGVAYVLEGSVRKAADRVRIAVDLVRASTGANVWSETYDRELKDIFAVQSEIATAVATQLQSKLVAGAAGGATPLQAKADAPPSGNVEAYNAYLRGKFFYARATEADDRTMLEQFTAATTIDPRYAVAWAWLARAWAGHAAQFLGGADAEQAFAKARAASETALALAPDLVAVHLSRAYVLANADFDWHGAEAEVRRAAQIAPDDGEVQHQLGRTLAMLGQPDRAVGLMRQALVTDPLNSQSYYWIAVYLSALGRLDEAESAVHKAIELQPGSAGHHEQLAIIAILRGDADAALAAAQAEPPGGWHAVAVALASQIGPDRAAADAALQLLIDKYVDYSEYQIAEAYALRNDADRTFEWLDRAFVDHDTGVTLLLVDPFIRRFHADPRLAAYCRKIGLPTPDEAAANARAEQKS